MWSSMGEWQLGSRTVVCEEVETFSGDLMSCCSPPIEDSWSRHQSKLPVRIAAAGLLMSNHAMEIGGTRDDRGGGSPKDARLAY
jgi:hypothetical protein